MLSELPDRRAGLSSTERLALSTVASGDVSAQDVQQVFVGADPQLLMYWEVGKLLDTLADPSHPAINGLECGPFDWAMHEEDFDSRYHRFRRAV